MIPSHNIMTIYYVATCFRRQICPNESFKLQLAMLEVQELGFSSVAKDSDPVWDFYDWNRCARQYLLV